jgi:hypothetical protein
MVDEARHDTTVIPNAKLTGKITNVARQIDVLIDSRHVRGATRRTIVDAKCHKRPVDVKQVEAFEGLMKDVSADHGILVCPNGYSKAARRRAQTAITIRLVPLGNLESLDLFAWEQCIDSTCEGLILWDATPGLCIDGLWTISATAKCDRCSRFHVWCWGCGNKFLLDDEDEHQCACAGPWFWLTSIEDDSDDPSKPLPVMCLLLVFGLGQYEIVDRRPLT